nr:unnamed protein product [Digitaria exilis]
MRDTFRPPELVPPCRCCRPASAAPSSPPCPPAAPCRPRRLQSLPSPGKMTTLADALAAAAHGARRGGAELELASPHLLGVLWRRR